MGRLGLGGGLSKKKWRHMGVAQILDHLTMALSSSSVIETASAPTTTLGQWQTADSSSPYTDALSPANAFTSSAPSVASINATTSVITLQGPGTTTFTRTAGGKTVTAGLTVMAEILASTPSSLSVTAGAGPSAALVIKDQNGVTVTSGCTFASSNTGVATVDSSGVVTYVAAGTCNIVATHTVDGETCTIGVTVSSGTVTLVLTQGGTPITSLAVNTGPQFQIADGAYLSNAPGTDILSQLTATTDDGTVCAIDEPEYLSNSSPTEHVTFSTDLPGGTYVFVISQGGVETITLKTANPRSTQTLGGLPTGVTASGATVVDLNHVSFDLTATTTAAATGFPAGIYIVDSDHGRTATEVLMSVYYTLAVTPSTYTLAIGGTEQLTAKISVSTDVTATTTWTTSNAGVATVNSAGLVTAVAAGTATITGTYPNATYPQAHTATAVMTVAAPAYSLTSISGTVIRGDSSVSHNIVGNGLVTGQTLLGLPTGVTAASIVASSGTAATVAISATGSATIGTDTGVYLHDATAGNTNTVSLVVSAPGNLLTSPLDLTVSPWVAEAASSVSLISTTLHGGGTGNVSRIVADNASPTSGGGGGDGRRQPVTISGGTASKQFTVSCWAKCETGTGNLQIKCTQSGVQDNFSVDKPLTTTWAQFSFVVTNGGSAGTGTQQFGFVRGTGTGTGFAFYIDEATATHP